MCPKALRLKDLSKFKEKEKLVQGFNSDLCDRSRIYTEYTNTMAVCCRYINTYGNSTYLFVQIIYVTWKNHSTFHKPSSHNLTSKHQLEK